MADSFVFSKFHRLRSELDPRSDDFARNRDDMVKLVSTLGDRLHERKFQGEPRRIKAHLKQNKLLARDRLALLLDEDSPFLEIAPLLGWGQNDVPKGNPLIGGIGVISGVECVLCVAVSTIGTGAASIVPQRKWNRLAQIAVDNKLPFVHCLESGGADLSQAFDVFHVDPAPFYLLSRMSAMQIPTVTIVFGTCIAGGAYMGGLSDYVVMVEGNAQLALAGTKLVEVATGEKSTDEELGGAAMHTRESGSCDFLASNEYDAIAKAREIIASLARPTKMAPPRTKSDPCPFPHFLSAQCREPFYSPEELLGVLPSGAGHKNFDSREVIARIVDGSEFFEFKPNYGSSLVTGWAYIYGVAVGFLANNGVIFHQSAQKAAHFINLCNQKGVPIVFLHNVTGFIVGRQYEADGILKWGSQMINAMSNSVVPNISILIGSSFGAGYYAMCGRGYNPRFMFSWPTAKCAVMGPDQLAGVMQLLGRERFQRRGVSLDEEKEQQLAQMTHMFKSRIENEMDAFYYSSRMIDDGVIDPRDTRRVLGVCLSVCYNGEFKTGFIRGVSRL